MASPAAQSKAQALNARMETEARVLLDEIDKQHVRKVARSAYACAVSCYDKAGASGSPDALEVCVQNCQIPHQQAHAYVQNVRIYFLFAPIHSLFPTATKPNRRRLATLVIHSFVTFRYSQEVAQFQNRLNRSMQECQDKARDMMQPGYENDAKKMAKVEDALISCMAKTVDEHIRMLKPMKDRILTQLKK
ncbi:predicted protein [Phaeodactylum tricornutum CCAP 1055/1]|jgi:hypothetical protein|uniref:Uncharacterized protein n=2 Tax=Phaeodactylum tricornutum TaxID=2850 RepID=B5Y3G6_PHATC|nr:predicted protein [Phaeodactylum tricornutum CCAP 1055/1]ACI65120.1 predicted protein [Phaeodactylum tricornutum CCAP 1055/1]|eukprot:XP_002185650.1 predicted protein [Phaeodactylum tricornutum CCAP 1055/1]